MKRSLLYIILTPLFLLPFSSCGIKAQNQIQQAPPQKTEKANPVLTITSNSPYYYYMMSRLYHNKNKSAQAISLLKQAISKDPDSIFLKKEMVNLYLEQDNFDGATKCAEKILDRDPGAIDVLFTLAKLRIKKNKKNEAIQIYNKILELEPNNKNTYLLLGKIYNKEKNSEQSFKLYSKMLEHFPDSYIAHYYLGLAYIDQNKLNYGEEEFLKTIELSPKLIEPRLRLIDIYKLHNKKQKQANSKIIKIYKEILQIEPHNEFVLMEYGLYLYNHGKKEKGEKIFFAFGKKSAANEKLLLSIVNEYIVKKRFKDASTLFAEMHKAVPENSTINFFTGYAFDFLKKYKQAVQYYQLVKPGTQYYKKSIIHTAFLHKDNKNTEKAIIILKQYHKTEPADIDIIAFLASLYVEKEDFKSCIKILNQGLSASKDNPTLLFKLGICMDKSGNKDKCIQLIKKVIQLDPDNPEALNYLGYTYAELGINLDKADKLINKALKLKPNDGYITDSLGWIYYQKGAYTKASILLQKAAELTSYDPIITEHLGDSYFKEKKLKKALSIYKKALKKVLKKNRKQKTKLKIKIKTLENQINAQE